MLLVTAGVRAAPGVLIVPLEDEFHWSRATISFAVGVNLLLYGLVGPFAAALMDRWGVRRTMTVALALTAAGVALTPLMQQSWQLVLLWGVMAGASCGLVGNFLAAYVATRWFRVRQGLVIGVLTAANAAGQLVFLPTMAGLATHAGWRVMSLTLAAVVVAFIPLAALLMRNRPEDLGLAPYGDDRGPRAAPAPASNPLAAAFRSLGEGAQVARFLADRRQLLHLRRLDQRAHRHASDPGLRRPRADRGHRRGPAGRHRRLRLCRRHALGLAQRPLGQPHAARLVLRAARAVAAFICRSPSTCRSTG